MAALATGVGGRFAASVAAGVPPRAAGTAAGLDDAATGVDEEATGVDEVATGRSGVMERLGAAVVREAAASPAGTTPVT